MKNKIKITLVSFTVSFIIAFLLTSCGVTKTTEKCDKEKKECCSKK
jgi:hypothetical protein